MNTETPRSERIVCGFAIAVLVAGFATGVFAKPNYARPHAPLHITQVSPVQGWQNKWSVSPSPAPIELSNWNAR